MCRASSFPVLHVNHNHSYRANDLFAQSLIEGGYGFAIVADPVRIPPDDSRWAGNSLESVAKMRGPAAGSLP